MVSVIVAVWIEVIWSVTAAVCVISIVFVCVDCKQEAEYSLLETYIIKNFGWNPNASKSSGLNNSHQLRSCDEVSQRLLNSLRGGICPRISLRHCLSGGKSMIHGLCCIYSFRGQPDPSCGHDHHRSDNICLSYRSCVRAGFCLVHRHCSWDHLGHGLEAKSGKILWKSRKTHIGHCYRHRGRHCCRDGDCTGTVTVVIAVVDVAKTELL